MNTDQQSSSMDLVVGQVGQSREEESSEYEENETDQILDLELNLNRLGCTPLDPIDWQDFELAETIHPDLRTTNNRNTVCKIYIDNEEFNCHLDILQGCSEVFNELVVLDNAELPSDEVSTGAFAFIYKWMITKESVCTSVSLELFLDIFKASVFLKIQELIDYFRTFLDNMDMFSGERAFKLYKAAKQKNVNGIRDIMLPRMQKFFLTLVSSQDWLDIDKEDAVIILSSDSICVNCEMEVFMSAIRWLNYRWEERQEDLIDMMNCIRFGNIEQWQLMDLKRSIEKPQYRNLTAVPAVCRMIDEGLQYVTVKDTQHENSSLHLQKPLPRNWSGIKKRYFTYREFLVYLHQFRTFGEPI